MNALEAQVLRLIGEDPDSPDVFTDDDIGMAPIRDSLNDAIQEINAITGGTKTTFSIPLIDGKTFYRLNFQTGFLGWVTDAWYVNSRRRLEQVDLARLSVFDQRWLIHTGTPDMYLQIGHDVIGFAPKPSGSNGVVELTCVLIPTKYTTDTDRIKLVDEYRWAAVNYAVSEYYAGRGDVKDAEIHMAAYMEALGLRSKYKRYADYSPQRKMESDPWPTMGERKPA